MFGYGLKWAHLAPVTILLTVTLAGTSPAITSLESVVPAGFEVTIQVDVRRLADTPEMEKVRGFYASHIANIKTGVEAVTGINILTDVDEIMLAGYLDQARKDEGLFLIRGRWDLQKLLALVRYNPQYQETPYGGRTIYSFWDQDSASVRYAASLEDEILVVGGKTAVEQSVDTLRGGASIESHTDYSSVRALAFPQNLVRLTARKPVRLPANDPGVLGTIEAACLTVDVADGFRIQLNGLMDTDANAVLMGKALQGIIALARLAKNKPEGAWLADRVVWKVEGQLLSASLSLTRPDVLLVMRRIPQLKPLGDYLAQSSEMTTEK